MSTIAYPESPRNVDPRKLEPGASFKKQVTKVIISILLFLVVYLLLMLLSVALVIGCFYAGLAIIVAKPSFITLMLGVGLMGLGISVFVFLVKFVFAVSRNENALRVEITKKDQPALFLFMRQLTQETNTAFPKKIFISADVNAAVFYNSSFWSMFLPVRKNLEIGLGFVNSVNISEFKAVMAHEFGHFSQRSMKLGSFTYNVNKIIYDMLYENKGYTNFLDSWGRVSGYFAFFASCTVRIAGGIQAILKTMYTIVNKNYMGLSREMEFHADAIAASVAGGNNLVNALSKIELAAECYGIAMRNANEWLKENNVSSNLFSYQLTVFRSMAADHQLSLKDGIPEVPFHFIQSFSRSRVNYKDQWASHPTLEERKNSLEEIGIDVAPLTTSAWALFNDPPALQQQMTKMLYGEPENSTGLEIRDELFFEDWFASERASGKLPAAYKGFYDQRYVNTAGWDIPTIAAGECENNLAALFNDASGQLQSSIASHERDLAVVQQIINKNLPVKTFDFDGVKFSADACDTVVQQLEQEIATLRSTQSAIEKHALAFFHQLIPHDHTLINAYQNYQQFESSYLAYSSLVTGLVQLLQPFYNEKCDARYIVSTIESMQANEEQRLKQFFKQLIDNGRITPDVKNKLLERIVSFNAKCYSYFSAGEFHNAELTELTELAFAVADELNRQKWIMYKDLLDLQLSRYDQNYATLN